MNVYETPAGARQPFLSLGAPRHSQRVAIFRVAPPSEGNCNIESYLRVTHGVVVRSLNRENNHIPTSTSPHPIPPTKCPQQRAR